MGKLKLFPTQENHKLFSVYHSHEYGSSHYLLWSEIFPNEAQIIQALEIDFEPEKESFLLPTTNRRLGIESDSFQ